MAPSAITGTEGRSPPTGPEPICQIITPVGMMGYGFNEEWTEHALQDFSSWTTPTALILDSGSTDSGPSKLALGTTTCPISSYERDFRKLLKLSVKYKAPILISSAGGDGTDDHVDLFLDIIKKICDEQDNLSRKFKTLAVYSQIDKTLVLEKLQAGLITGCGPSVPPLTSDLVSQTPRVVAQMGPEPLLDAMNANPDFDILIAGRAYDVAPYVSWAAFHSLEPKQRDLTKLTPKALGSLTHMGKILECGGLCATPKGMGALGIINSDHSVDIRPLDPDARCIPLSVAAHSLYEKTRPHMLPGPGGYLDLSTAEFTQLEDGVTTRVRGSVFRASQDEGLPYTVKLEGARVSGYRTLMMGSFGDAILIPQIHSFLEAAKAHAQRQHQDVKGTWEIGFHVYGFNEKMPDIMPSQVFVVTEVCAQTQDLATSLASAVRVSFAHGSYPGQKATSGSFGMGIGGSFELETGACAEFSIYHLMPLLRGQEHAQEVSTFNVKNPVSPVLFTWRVTEIGHGKAEQHSTAISHDNSSPLPFHKVAAKQLVAPVAMEVTSSVETLVDIAKIVRSKNAGPFEVTLDVMFDNVELYNAVKDSGILSREIISDLYHINTEDVVWAGFFDVAMAFKATIPRIRNGKPSASGGFMEDDVHGSQQYNRLAQLRLPEILIQRLSKKSQQHD